MDKLLLVIFLLMAMAMAGAPMGVSFLRSMIPPDETGFAAVVFYYSAPLATMIPITLFVFMLKKSDSKK